jgi:gluconate 2-dehydrogenase gamma chain
VLVSRRFFMTGLGVAATVPGAVLPVMQRASAGPRHPNLSRYFFFEASEAGFIEAACERLIPADASGPGALDAGVAQYMDLQLAGPWGAGEQPYRSGPWQPGTAAQVHPPWFKPAQLFRTALAAIRRDLATRGVPGEGKFGELTAGLQDAYLRFLEAGGADLDGVPSAIFFRLLLTMTVEGFFSDPRHGNSRDRLSWRLHGFPGSHAIALSAAGSGPPRQETRREIPKPSLD